MELEYKVFEIRPGTRNYFKLMKEVMQEFKNREYSDDEILQLLLYRFEKTAPEELYNIILSHKDSYTQKKAKVKSEGS